MKIKTFQAFRSRNYRLYFSGQSISLVGTWMQRTALYWLIYTQTHSAFMLGLAVFAAQFPSFLFSPLGGVVSDRYNRYRVLLITQIASMIQAALLVLLVVFTKYAVWELLALSVILGTINAFDVPARQSLVHQLVTHKDDLPNAIALNSSMVTLAQLIGPATSGIVLEKFGAGACFLINAVSYVAVITSLLLMTLPPFIPAAYAKNVLNDFKEGLVYLKNVPAIGLLILLIACSSLFVIPYSTLLPVYAKVVFRGNAATFGYLNSAIGLGAICGAVFLASRKKARNFKTVLFSSLFILGVGLMLFSHTLYFPLALAFAMLAGFGMMTFITVSNTLLQTQVSQEMRGRVISYFAMAYFGMLPIGGLLTGFVSQRIGAPDTILAEGIAAVLITLLFLAILRKYILKRKAESNLTTLEEATLPVNYNH